MPSWNARPLILYNETVRKATVGVRNDQNTHICCFFSTQKPTKIIRHASPETDALLLPAANAVSPNGHGELL